MPTPANTEYGTRAKTELRHMYDSEAKDRLARLEDYEGVDVCSLDKFNPATNYFYRKKLAQMVRMSGIRKGDHLLEVGCKDGLVTFLLAGMGYRVTAIDLSPESIELARAIQRSKSIEGVEFRVADAEDLRDLPRDAFDAAICFSVMRYIPDPVKAFKAVLPTIKPGATFVCDFPNRYCPWFSMLKPFTGTAPHIHDHLYSPAQVKRLFEETGYRDVEVSLLLYMYKELPSGLVWAAKTFGEVMERIPLLNRTAAIIMGRGRKG